MSPLIARPNVIASYFTTYGFSDLSGTLTWRGDAVMMQRQLRDEWKAD
jgi:hypothetical protein